MLKRKISVVQENILYIIIFKESDFAPLRENYFSEEGFENRAMHRAV